MTNKKKRLPTVVVFGLTLVRMSKEELIEQGFAPDAEVYEDEYNGTYLWACHERDGRWALYVETEGLELDSLPCVELQDAEKSLIKELECYMKPFQRVYAKLTMVRGLVATSNSIDGRDYLSTCLFQRS